MRMYNCSKGNNSNNHVALPFVAFGLALYVLLSCAVLLFCCVV